MNRSACRCLIAGLAWLTSAAAAAQPPDSQQMARRIDQLLAARWEEQQLAAAASSSDAEFHRRLSLDLCGVVPTVAAARSFAADTSDDKRSALIQRLLRSPRHATHMAAIWRQRLLPDQFQPGDLQRAAGLQQWLRRQFVSNLRYDNLVAELIASRGTIESGPALYFTALEIKPEKLAASTARIFLGLQIQCAECHDHPYDHWKQQDFWGYAAFFAQLQSAAGAGAGGSGVFDADAGEVSIPGTSTPAALMFPGGIESTSPLGGTRRQQLAIWLASRDNPYLSRAAVNWAWAHLFGRGLVDPVDDLGAHNPPSHPELLDELSDYFARSGFDLRGLLATLCSTRAYQLSSKGAPQTPPELFARMAVKTLTPEQYYDSLVRCLSQSSNDISIGPGAAPVDGRRLQFVARMQSQSRSALEYENGPPQALLLMNGPLSSEATDVSRSALLAALEAPFFSDAQRLETLFLATLTRLPTAAESQRMLPLVQQAADRRPQVLSDILWAVLNSGEFALNH